MYKSLCLALFSSSLSASPFLITDPYPIGSEQVPTHCGVYIGTNPKVEIPITTDVSGSYCYYDLESEITFPIGGLRDIKVTFILKDSLYSTESDPSNTIQLDRPGKPLTPDEVKAKP